MSENETTDLSRLRIHRGERPSSGPPRRSPWRILAIIAGCVIAAVILYTFFGSTAVEVETTTITTISGAQGSAALTASGYVVAQRKAAIASKATGRLVYLGFVEGDHVKKGDIIGRIESSDVEAALAQAKANLGVSEADRQDAENSLKRAKQLLDRKLISEAEMDAAQARYDRVLAGITASRAAVQQAQVQVENTMIRAPFDGTILTKNADVGEVVSPLSAGASSRVAVVTLADMGSLQVEADVSESNLEKVRINQPCQITLDAYPDRTYRGSVAKIVPTADRAKATVMTKIRFEETDSRVLPEMGAKVRFLDQAQPKTDQQQAPKTVAPVSAVITRGNQKVVFVIDGGAVKQTPVTTGQVDGSFVEITSGAQSGQRIVNKPADALKDGSKIKIKE